MHRYVFGGSQKALTCTPVDSQLVGSFEFQWAAKLPREYQTAPHSTTQPSLLLHVVVHGIRHSRLYIHGGHSRGAKRFAKCRSNSARTASLRTTFVSAMVRSPQYLCPRPSDAAFRKSRSLVDTTVAVPGTAGLPEPLAIDHADDREVLDAKLAGEILR